MRSALAALGLLASTGCAQLFGLKDTKPEADAAVGASLHFKQVFYGPTVVDQPLDLTTGTASYLVPDASDPTGLRRVATTLSGVDTWTADIADGTPAYPLFTLPDTSPGAQFARSFQLPAHNLRAVYAVLSHPGAEAAPANAALDFAITLDAPYAAGESFQWYTVGSWTQRAFTGVELPAIGGAVLDPPPIPFATATPLGGRPLARLIASDVVLALRYTGATLSGQAVAPSFEQVDGPQAIAGAMTAVPADQMLDVVVDPAATTSRFTKTQPALPATVATSWSLSAAVGQFYGSNQGPLLSSGAVAAIDTTIKAPYGNPFDGRGWPTTFTYQASVSRSYQPTGGGPPVSLSAGLGIIGAAPIAGATVKLDAGLPLITTLDGTALISDGMTVTIDRSHPLTLTFIADRSVGTIYQAVVYEIDPTTAAYVPRLSLVAATPSFVVPPEFLEAGKLYTIRAGCVLGGFADVPSGNLELRTLPLASGYADSAAFTVTP